MTRPSAALGLSPPASPWEGPQVALVQAGDKLERWCTRCGAVGTHYLTCPGLRLPPGYRLSEDREAECGCGLPAASCGELCVTGRIGPGFRPGSGMSRGGPDHPDWPRPPRHS